MAAPGQCAVLEKILLSLHNATEEKVANLQNDYNDNVEWLKETVKDTKNSK